MLAGVDSVTVVDLQVQDIDPVATVAEEVAQQVADKQLGQAQCIVQLVVEHDFAQQVVAAVVQQVGD